MNAQRVPKRYNLIKITIWCALFAPLFLELINWLTGFVMLKHGLMDRWPIMIYMTLSWIMGMIIQQLEYIKPDRLSRIFLMLCWMLTFFVSSLFWESFLRDTPKGMEALKMLMLYPTLITGVYFAFGLSVRETRPYL